MHIVAKHAGYEVLEINASEDRTGKALDAKVVTALESHRIHGNGSQGKKPTLVVMDEVDGVARGTGRDGGGGGGGGDKAVISKLIALATAPLDGDADGQGKQMKRRKKKKKGAKATRPLLRPIICICNNLYDPVLRPLREVAQTYRIGPYPTHALAQRLKFITEAEGLTGWDSRALARVCERTQGDLRASLNLLQVQQNPLSKALKTGEAQRKDTRPDLFATLEAIFDQPSPSSISRLERAGWKERGEVRHTKVLRDLITRQGEYDKLMDGCFEQYLRMPWYDGPCMRKPGDAAEVWFGFWEHLNSGSLGQQEILSDYKPFILSALHTYFAGQTLGGAQRDGRGLGYPRKDYTVRTDRLAHAGIIRDFMRAGDKPYRYLEYSREGAVTSLLPWLLRIISPPVSATHRQLLGREEGPRLGRVCEVMRDHGLRWIQERKAPEAEGSNLAGGMGEYVYRLDPPVDTFLSWSTHDGMKPLGVGVLPRQYAVRQLIAQEMERRRLRILEEAKALEQRLANERAEKYGTSREEVSAITMG